MSLSSSDSFPAPYGPLPAPRHLLWHEREMYGFLHFSVNTFTGKGWGYGDESPSLFNPTAFDADQIARVSAEAGLKGLVLTCKHHDGFCLWPSRYTEHSVKNSPWKDGNGNIVREISDACRRHGIPFGVYLSPWDRNHPDYGKPEYLTYYRSQLRELLTEYGPLFEVWFDGANGGDGYYGGAREVRRIDNTTYYDWDNTWAIVRELQPDACIFSDGGPDVRWVGNEEGYADPTCWATFNLDGFLPGVRPKDTLGTGDFPGTHWVPAEVDVSIRRTWFYRPAEDSQVKSVPHLLKIYFESVGRGANLILNLPPDQRGVVHENDVAALEGWNRVLTATFSQNLAAGASITASNTRASGDPRFAPAHVLDAHRDTFWTTDDDILTPTLTLETDIPITFNVIRLREYLPLGQRIEEVAIDYREAGQWKELVTAASIGNNRLIAIHTVTTDAVRLRITRAARCPAISEFAFFAMPEANIKELREILAAGK